MHKCYKHDKEFRLFENKESNDTFFSINFQSRCLRIDWRSNNDSIRISNKKKKEETRKNNRGKGKEGKSKK